MTNLYLFEVSQTVLVILFYLIVCIILYFLSIYLSLYATALSRNQLEMRALVMQMLATSLHIIALLIPFVYLFISYKM